MGIEAEFSTASVHPESLHQLMVQGSKTLHGRDNQLQKGKKKPSNGF